MKILIKRVYDAPAASDGLRALVDRLWPRGLSKQDAAIDRWAKELAPSTELRKWFAHDETKFDEFAERYQAELRERDKEVQNLLTEAGQQTLTLVYAAKNTQINHAVVLRRWLEEFVNKKTTSQ